MGRIGIHDHNFPSALSALEVYHKDRHVFVHYENLPPPSEEVPPVFLINPTSSSDRGYWESIRECIKAHPKTKFVMVMPDSGERAQAQQILARPGNIEYVELGDTSRLNDILEGKE